MVTRLSIFVAILATPLVWAGGAAIHKVNTHRTDSKKNVTLDDVLAFGKHASYRDPNQTAAPQFEIAVKWSAGDWKQAVTLRLEYRQTRLLEPLVREMEYASTGGARWSRFVIPAEELEKCGDVAAWKVSVVSAGKVIASKKSLVWDESASPSKAP